MQRKQIDKISQWNDQKTNIPLLITGARNVGKTYLVYDFAKSFYEKIIYMNLERELNMRLLFRVDHKEQILQGLLDYFHFIKEDKILIIIDEIALCKDALDFLNDTCIIPENIKIIAISSQNISSYYHIPSKQFTEIIIYAMDFEEFLGATGNGWYISVITEHFNSNVAIPDIVHKELLALLESYLMVGGMPAAINEYLNTESLINISQQHSLINNSYIHDFGKYNNNTDNLKLTQIYEIMDEQLGKENKKFQYNSIKRGATKKLYEKEIAYLATQHLAIKCVKRDCFSNLECHDKNKEMCLNDENGPNDERRVSSSFKLYFSDVGLLYSRLKEKIPCEFNSNIRKGLYENYIAQSLVANGYRINFWESKSQAKIEFVITRNNAIIPIEVKTSDYTRSKSLSVFKSKHFVDSSIIISSTNFRYSNGVKYVPIYAVFCI